MRSNTSNFTLNLQPPQAIKKTEKLHSLKYSAARGGDSLFRSDTHTPREAGGSGTDDLIAQQLKVSALTVANVRQRACERGALVSVRRQEQLHRKARKLEGHQEAHLVAVACSTPPDGASTWTLRLLRERLLELEVVEHIGLETIRQTLKKTRSSRG